MKIEKRSKKMDNIIEGAKELAVLLAFAVAMYGLCLVLFAGGPQ